jgi:hypothetical protein
VTVHTPPDGFAGLVCPEVVWPLVAKSTWCAITLHCARMAHADLCLSAITSWLAVHSACRAFHRAAAKSTVLPLQARQADAAAAWVLSLGVSRRLVERKLLGPHRRFARHDAGKSQGVARSPWHEPDAGAHQGAVCTAHVA